MSRKKSGALIIGIAVLAYAIFAVLLFVAASSANAIFTADTNLDWRYDFLETVHHRRFWISFFAYFILIMGISAGTAVIANAKKVRIAVIGTGIALFVSFVAFVSSTMHNPYASIDGTPKSMDALSRSLEEKAKMDELWLHPGSEIQFTGIIQEFVDMTALDGPYYLIVKTQDGDFVKVFFADSFGLGFTHNPNCPYTVEPYLKKEGTSVAVFGKVAGIGEISLCGSKNYSVVPRIL
ncbi:hypothetical protein HY621_02380 [Candidatus Uhrbacteria bacterium]|nr:hypothetical protein [Candidatus Uhrbacteria bacterium]